MNTDLSGFLSLFSAAFFCAGLFVHAGEHQRPREGALKEGETAPDFALKSPDGKTSFTLSAHKGKKPVVLIFGSYT